tara:strand:- start:1280 stop:2152 length:873 start_codon:yes stop_codon:yes gene_type:complete
MLQAEVKKLKITAENINSVLTKKNDVLKKRKKKKEQLEKIITARSVRREKESKIEKKSPIGGAFKSSLDSIKKTVISGPMDVMGKVIQFGALLLLGGMFQAIPEFLTKGGGLFGKLGEWGQGIADFFSTMWEGAKNFFTGVKEDDNVKKALEGIQGAFEQIGEMLPDLSNVSKIFKNEVDNSPLKDAVNDLDLLEAAKKLSNGEDNELSKFVDNEFNDKFGDVDLNIPTSDIDKKAIGGPSGGWTLVGERGPEVLFAKTTIQQPDLIGNNSVWGGKTKTIYMPQRLIVKE